VRGPPAASCLLKMGMTLPLEPRTFPKRTETNFVGGLWVVVVLEGEDEELG